MRSLLLALSLLPAIVPAQGTLPAWRSRLLGVYDATTGDPVEGAEVGDVMAKVTALTTKTGTVTLSFLPEGGTLVRIRKVGFEPTTMMVAISPTDTIPLTVLLARSTQVLPTVVTRDSAPKFISPGLRAFEERRKSGNGGRFISEAELRKNDGGITTMTNMIRRLPGLKIICPKSPSPRSGECWAVSGRSQSKYAILGGECTVEVYLNGAPSIDNDLNKLQVSEFAGVEYYAGASVPAQYNRTGSVCGVLLLWSREK